MHLRAARRDLARAGSGDGTRKALSRGVRGNWRGTTMRKNGKVDVGPSCATSRRSSHGVWKMPGVFRAGPCGLERHRWLTGSVLDAALGIFDANITNC